MDFFIILRKNWINLTILIKSCLVYWHIINHELLIWVRFKKLFIIVQHLWDLCTNKLWILQYIKVVALKSVFSATQFCLVQQKEGRVVGKLIFVFFEMPILPFSLNRHNRLLRRRAGLNWSFITLNILFLKFPVTRKLSRI